MTVHTFNPGIWEKASDLSDFEASLVDTAISTLLYPLLEMFNTIYTSPLSSEARSLPWTATYVRRCVPVIPHVRY